MPTSRTVRSAIHAYRRGWIPVPLHENKRPINPEETSWNKQRWSDEAEIAAAFGGAPNIGVLLGTPSGGLVDIDIDGDVAREIANSYPILPNTPLESGHDGAPRSHRWFRVKEDLRTQKLIGPAEPGQARKPIVEVRSTGSQTMIPSSVHEEHGPVRWHHGADEVALPDPLLIEGQTLLANVNLLAMISVIVEHWPGDGGRHDAHLALAGGLLITATEGLPHGWWAERAEGIIGLVADITHDEEGRNRRAGVRSTLDAIRQGRKVQGWPTLANLIGEAPTESVRGFASEIVRLHDWQPEEAASAALPAVDLPGVVADPLEGSDAGEADEDVLEGTLADEYPEAPDEIAQIFSKVALDNEEAIELLTSSPWGQVTTADQQVPPVEPPSVGHRSDGLALFSPGTTSLVFGSARAGKTFATMAVGAQVLKEGGSVLHLDWEVGRVPLIDRYRQIEGLTPGALSRCHLIHPGSARLGSVGSADRGPGEWSAHDLAIAQRLLDVRPDLVIVDSLTRLVGRHGLNPNHSTGIELLEPFLVDLLPSLGAVVLVIDHSGRSESERVAGSFRKDGFGTGMVLRIENDERMGRGLHGWSHAYHAPTRDGWIDRHTNEEGHLFTFGVDNTSFVDDQNPGRLRFSIDPPKEVGQITTSIELGERHEVEVKGPPEPTGQQVLDAIVYALESEGPRSPTKMADHLIQAMPGLPREKARTMISSWVDDGTLAHKSNPKGRGIVLIP